MTSYMSTAPLDLGPWKLLSCGRVTTYSDVAVASRLHLLLLVWRHAYVLVRDL
eukprot:COSAG01_NODE_20177_length_966_cov_13.619377_1_plen_52_part_10